jgi:hypothetical protein
VAQRHQAVSLPGLPRLGFSISSTLGVHVPDHPAHHLKIVSGEVSPALTKNMQHLGSWVSKAR